MVRYYCGFSIIAVNSYCKKIAILLQYIVDKPDLLTYFIHFMLQALASIPFYIFSLVMSLGLLNISYPMIVRCW